MCIIDCVCRIVLILGLDLDYRKVIIVMVWWGNFEVEYWGSFELVCRREKWWMVGE